MFGKAFLGWRTPACHPSLRSGSHTRGTEILRCAQDDTREYRMTVRSRIDFPRLICKWSNELEFLAPPLQLHRYGVWGSPNNLFVGNRICCSFSTNYEDAG